MSSCSSCGSSSSIPAQIAQAQLSQLKTSGEISTRVARKALDAQQEQGQAAIDLLKSATEVAKAASRGSDGRLDVTA